MIVAEVAAVPMPFTPYYEKDGITIYHAIA